MLRYCAVGNIPSASVFILAALNTRQCLSADHVARCLVVYSAPEVCWAEAG